MSISTHVLDTSKGRPGSGVVVTLEYRTVSGDWDSVGSGATDSDGRVAELIGDSETMANGHYRLTFNSGDYYRDNGVTSFHPHVSIEFEVGDQDEHYHIPLLISPFGYTTYRGS